jgi:hypothetical protein
MFMPPDMLTDYERDYYELVTEEDKVLIKRKQ